MTTATQPRPEPPRTLSSENGYGGSRGSLAQRIRQLVQAEPLLSTKAVCARLHLKYTRYGQYVRNQKSLWKRNKCNKRNTLQHDSHRNKYVWSVPEWRKYREQLVEDKWHLSARNKLWFFNHEYGSILWHNTDRIELFLSGKPIIAHAKTVFARGLTDYIDIREIERVFDGGQIESRHHTFTISEKIPRFQIDYFAGSHGLTILNDNSHKKAIEVVETRPFWLEALEEISVDFKENMAKHMQLLDAMTTLQHQMNERARDGLLRRIKRVLWGDS